MTFDVAAFQSSSPYASQTLADSQNNGQTLTGMAKLSQRFILELMTGKNSVPLSTEGCNFVARLKAGVASETDVFLAFHSSLGDVAKLLASQESSTDTPDEQLASVAVISLLLDASSGSLSLALRLRNKAGVTHRVSLPLHFILG